MRKVIEVNVDEVLPEILDYLADTAEEAYGKLEADRSTKRVRITITVAEMFSERMEHERE